MAKGVHPSTSMSNVYLSACISLFRVVAVLVVNDDGGGGCGGGDGGGGGGDGGFRFYIYIIVALVNRGVLTLVSEIPYKDHRYYYY